MKKLYITIFVLFLSACTRPVQTNEFWIKNSQNENIFIRTDGLENVSSHKLVIIQHGLASNMNHTAVQEAKQAFLDNHYVVVTFDSRYSLGKGNNDVEKVELKTFTQDLETVADWVKKQPFYTEPFALVGHSLGGASVIEFSAKYPEQVSILVPITPVVSGKLWEKSCMENMPDFCRRWQHNGVYEYTDKQNNKTAIIPFSVVTSSKNYDAYNLATQINAKTLLIAAENDIVINPDDIRNLSKHIDNALIATIKSSGHNFEEQQNRNDLYQAINAFLTQ